MNVFAYRWLDAQRGNLAPKTVEVYQWALDKWVVPNLGQRYVSELTIDDVARLVARMKSEGKKAWTIRAVLTPLSRMMSHAVRGGLAASNPVRGLDKSERPKGDQRQMRILSSEEIGRLLAIPLRSRSDMSYFEAAQPKPPLSDHWRPLITFLLFTGMRISEALNVRWEDVSLEDGTVTVRESKTLAGTGRSVILIPALTSILRRERLRSAYSAPQDYVFPNMKGGMLNRHYILGKVLKPACVAAGIPHTTLHELRHTFASILIGQGNDPTLVSEQLGHANPSITMSIYAKLFDSKARKDEARDKLQTAFGGLL
jgi:integrase